MVFVIATLSRWMVDGGVAELTCLIPVTEVYYLNVALALFNTGTSRSFTLPAPQLTCSPSYSYG